MTTKKSEPKKREAKIAVPEKKQREAKIPVSELNLRKAAARLLATSLVSPEVMYIQSVLGNSATQEELDAKVVAVRTMPWASIMLPE